MSQPTLLCEADRPTPVHYRILVAAWAGWTFDFYDLMLLTFLETAICADFGLVGAQRLTHWAQLLSISLLATAAGGAIFAVLGDRFGRRAMMQWSILTYSVGAFLCGFADGLAPLALARVVTGLGVGGEWAMAHTLVAETFPPKVRGRFGALVQTGAPIGVGLAALAGSFLAPQIGWRAVFMVSALPALLVVYIRRQIPESDLWQRERARGGTGAARALRALVARGMRGLAAKALLLATFNMSAYWFTYIWLPGYLVHQRHLTIARSGLKVLVVVFGELLGYASFGWVSDRIGRRPAFTIYAMIMALGLAMITLQWGLIEHHPGWLLFFLALTGFGTGTWSNFGPMFSELFPTVLRATATGTLFNAARGAQFAAPLVIAAMAARWGLAGGISLGAGFAVLAGLWVWTFPETRGRELHRE